MIRWALRIRHRRRRAEADAAYEQGISVGSKLGYQLGQVEKTNHLLAQSGTPRVLWEAEFILRRRKCE
tara:strand:+ start:817 stop:1020 length:204 start_codon:yes stop_codon:yes gene_type:complete